MAQTRVVMLNYAYRFLKGLVKIHLYMFVEPYIFSNSPVFALDKNSRKKYYIFWGLYITLFAFENNFPYHHHSSKISK